VRTRPNFFFLLSAFVFFSLLPPSLCCSIIEHIDLLSVLYTFALIYEKKEREEETHFRINICFRTTQSYEFCCLLHTHTHLFISIRIVNARRSGSFCSFIFFLFSKCEYNYYPLSSMNLFDQQ